MHPKTEQNSDKTKMALLYHVDDVPPWYLCLLLGLQQYLTMFSSAITLPFLLAPKLCMEENSPARAHLISAILFSSGIVTILQTTIGVRLPIVQGGTYSFLVPIFSLLSLPEFACPNQNGTDTESCYTSTNTSNFTQVNKYLGDNDDLWQERMRVVQGSIIVASLLEVFLGMTGCIGALLHYITPLTIVPTITLVGLSFFEDAADLAGKNWGASIGTMVLLMLFSQCMQSIKIPVPKYSDGTWSVKWTPVFALLPVLLTIVIAWIACTLLTTFEAVPIDSAIRTDKNSHILERSPWFRLPYPGQWGMPTVNAAGVVGILAGVVASIVESIGDYFACARLSGAKPPPGHAINRGIMIEGIGCIIAGLYGTGVGTTSYSENIGAIGITKVASRRVIQFAGLVMVTLGVFTKFGALFVSIPTPIVGGIFLVMSGMIMAVGLSGLQFVDLNSSRNLVVFGFSIFAGLSIPKWVHRNKCSINTGNELLDQVLFVLLSTNMLVGGILGCILDHIFPGTEDERGITTWKELTNTRGRNRDADESSSYDLPFIMPVIRKWKFARNIPFSPTFESKRNDNDNQCQSRLDANNTDNEQKHGQDNYAFDSSNV